MTKEQAIYKKAVDLIANFDSSFLELGQLLRQAQDNDHDLFEHLLTVPGLGRRKGYYLAKIDRDFEPYNIENARLISIGWTKLMMIGPFLADESVQSLLSLAEAHTARNLKGILNGEKPPKKTRVILLYLTKKQYRAYAKAIMKHGGQKKGRGLANHEAALMNLVAKSK